MGAGCGASVKKGKGWRSTKWQLQNSHREVEYSMWNIVRNIVITVVAGSY